jgi:hypothetical protein
MIHESYYWKQPLLKAADWHEGLRITEKNSERTLVRVEREIFVGFYGIRKLLDTFAVSDKIKAKIFDLKWFPILKSVDYLNWHTYMTTTTLRQ